MLRLGHYSASVLLFWARVQLGNGPSPATDHLSQGKAWVKLMKEADDGDGALSFEEFADMVRKAADLQIQNKAWEEWTPLSGISADNYVLSNDQGHK